MRHERSRTMATVKVAEVSDVPAGTGKVVQAGGKTLALFNLGGTFHALDNRCTHMGGPLGEGAVEGNGVRAPCTARFLIIPTARGVGLPARGRLRPFQYKLRGIKS